MRTTVLTLSLSVASLALTGCDVLGIETAPQVAAKKAAEAHAIGSGCRHAVRSIEDCFQSHPKAVKAAMFDGWKEMDTYMRENEILGMPSTATTSTRDPANGSSTHKPPVDANAHTGTAHKS